MSTDVRSEMPKLDSSPVSFTPSDNPNAPPAPSKLELYEYYCSRQNARIERVPEMVFFFHDSKSSKWQGAGRTAHFNFPLHSPVQT